MHLLSTSICYHSKSNLLRVYLWAFRFYLLVLDLSSQNFDSKIFFCFSVSVAHANRQRQSTKETDTPKTLLLILKDYNKWKHQILF